MTSGGSYRGGAGAESPLGDRVLIVQFIGTQAGFTNSLLKPKMDKVREKFFGSVAAE